MKTNSLVSFFAVLLLSFSSGAVVPAKRASPLTLLTGQYLCGPCQLVLQQTGHTIMVTPGNGCGDRGQTAEYSLQYDQGRRYYVTYKTNPTYGVYAAYMRLTSQRSYVFSSLGRKLLCVKI